MNLNPIEEKVEALHTNFKVQGEFVNNLDKRTLKNEIHLKYVDEQLKEVKSEVGERLNNIESKVNTAVDLINKLTVQVSKQEAVADTKKYIWTFILALAGAVGALGLHTFVFKFFGADI